VGLNKICTVRIVKQETPVEDHLMANCEEMILKDGLLFYHSYGANSYNKDGGVNDQNLRIFIGEPSIESFEFWLLIPPSLLFYTSIK